MYSGMLDAIGGGGAPDGAPPGPSNGASLGSGPVPKMGGLPPPPTMTGKMPTGASSSTAKEAADNAILKLREAKGHFPSLGAQIDGVIDAIKKASKPMAPSKVGTPPAPGSALGSAPIMESGSGGPV